MTPTITVAIPLHQSTAWVDNIVDNVRCLPDIVTEIIVSDRTCLDNAAAQLRARLADDHRVIVTADPVGAGWEDHFQLLVEEARGDLFMWMPHDDIFDPSWVPILTSALEANTGAWLAYGRLERVEIDGVTPLPDSWPPKRRPGVITGWSALRMMLGNQMGVPFRGLFRREDVLAAGIRMTPAKTFCATDMLWVFAVALRSALVYDDRTVTRKRYYPTSTHPSWHRRPGDVQRGTLALLREHGPGGAEGALMRWFTAADWVKARVRPPLSRLPRTKRLFRRLRGLLRGR